MPPRQYLFKYLEDQEIVDVVKDNLTTGQQSMKGLGMKRNLGQGIPQRKEMAPREWL